ncbi:hypothetical protein L0Y40_02100 [Candidatus Wolfebacteria bacterium]|nr:hypothetical protein [Candidatus Wolfebacteria bacterium]
MKIFSVLAKAMVTALMILVLVRVEHDIKASGQAGLPAPEVHSEWQEDFEVVGFSDEIPGTGFSFVIVRRISDGDLFTAVSGYRPEPGSRVRVLNVTFSHHTTMGRWILVLKALESPSPNR